MLLYSLKILRPHRNMYCDCNIKQQYFSHSDQAFPFWHNLCYANLAMALRSNCVRNWECVEPWHVRIKLVSALARSSYPCTESRLSFLNDNWDCRINRIEKFLHELEQLAQMLIRKRAAHRFLSLHFSNRVFLFEFRFGHRCSSAQV